LCYTYISRTRLIFYCSATICLYIIPAPPTTTPFPYTTLFRSEARVEIAVQLGGLRAQTADDAVVLDHLDHDATGEHPLGRVRERSEEHTSELQSRFDLVCRLLLEKKNLILQMQM